MSPSDRPGVPSSSFSVPVFTSFSDGSPFSVTTVGSSLVSIVPEVSLTGSPEGGLPVAVAVFSTEPKSMSSWVTS